MTQRLDTIQLQSEAVVSDGPSGMSHRYQFRALTSLVSVPQRTYTDWTDIHGLVTGRRHTEVYDPARGASAVMEVQSFRVAKSEPRLEVGYQFQDRAGLVWQVLGLESEGPGTLRWQLGRDISVLGTADRKTGR